MIVVYGGEKVDISIDENDTIDEVIQRAAMSVGQQKSDLKLIHKGKILLGTSKIIEIGNSNAKLLLVGNSSGNTVIPNAASKLIRDDLTEEGRNHRRPYAISVRDIKQRTNASPYRFHKVTPLSHYPDAHRAHTILNSLANDPGILHVLELHKWSVGELCEMEPEGYVGVSEVCVLGLNQNKGQRIYLRIRTDDKLGFRKILTIRNVLYHELAHNEHSDHDDAFYRLMRQVQREAEAADWTRGRAHRLSNHSVYEAPDVSEQTVQPPRILGGISSRSALLDAYETQQSDFHSGSHNDENTQSESNSHHEMSNSEEAAPSVEVHTSSSIDVVGNTQDCADSVMEENNATVDLFMIVDTCLAQCFSGDSTSSSEYLLRLAGVLADIIGAVHQSVQPFMETCSLLRDIVVRAQVNLFSCDYQLICSRMRIIEHLSVTRSYINGI